MSEATDRNAIKAIIFEYPARFESVVKLYGSDMVVQIISSLLENGTFALETNAQLESAKTHQPSALRDRQHDALEQEAAQSEAMALDEASRSDLAMLEGDLGGEHVDVAEVGPNEDPSGSISPKSPSLFPSYLSYISQHKLLNAVQRVLENCCYDWAARWIPSLLNERNWTCSEAVELGRWTAIIPKRADASSFDAKILGSGEALTAVFQATHPLRHAAVHRLRTSVKGIEKMLRNALKLATALQDTPRKRKLHDILVAFRATMQAMERKKNDLENQLDTEICNIQEQRAALDKKAKEARLGMFQQDRENTVQFSCLFENSIRNLTSTDEPDATGMEQDNSRNHVSEEACDDAVVGGTSEKHSAEVIRHTTDKASCGNRDSKPSNHGDSEANTADSTKTAQQAIEDEMAALPSQFDLEGSNLPSQSTGR
ncbi:hypothetical protein HO173_002652 [Letharia columbiana]|uniref:Uncharacterized protein n=1 Tax=Letharia columbiana TaxID=112416 RepID=A0A8H6G2K2_9LECA|nr:uncharacterized protein HO173_002652 [Letharia columbiana]KAF6239390.1 hypothetical protein HO173_002652 [Letharia columbiana]